MSVESPYHSRRERLRAGHRHPLPDARRADPEQLHREILLVRDSPLIAALLDAVDAILLVLNPQRQVVAFKGPRGSPEQLAGLRPGELLACVNAGSSAGCGTTAACETCGTLGAILGCERIGRSVGAECVIATDGGAALEFDVRASPVQLDGLRFTVVSMRDVSAAKRREALEQVFFHDVLNTVSGMRGWTHHLSRPGADVRRAGERLDVLCRQLEREISDHRALVLAESGALVPGPSAVNARDLLDEVTAVFSQHAAGRDRTIETSLPSDRIEVETDRALLVRVLVNMVRNALEAIEPGGTIRLRCDAEAADPAGGVRFSVHNEGTIPPEIQARIFQRSFSTKGPGRGLGTYGMKLIGERYLGGRVSFRSTHDAGTTFSIRLPARFAPRHGRTAPSGPPERRQ